MCTPKAEPDKPSKHLKGIGAHKKLLAWLLGIATLVGGIVVVIPRPTVVQGDPADPGNSMSAPFHITNSGFVPLWHTTALVGVGQVTGTADQALNPNFVPDFKSRMTKPEWKDHTLNMDDKFDITPGDVLAGGPWGQGDIAIIVSYQPWFIPWGREKLFRFITHKQTNGNLYWYSVPLPAN